MASLPMDSRSISILPDLTGRISAHGRFRSQVLYVLYRTYYWASRIAYHRHPGQHSWYLLLSSPSCHDVHAARGKCTHADYPDYASYSRHTEPRISEIWYDECQGCNNRWSCNDRYGDSSCCQGANRQDSHIATASREARRASDNPRTQMVYMARARPSYTRYTSTGRCPTFLAT